MLEAYGEDFAHFSLSTYLFVQGIHKVTIQDAQGSNHSLSRYYALWNKPRPESSTIVRLHNSYS